MDGEITIIELNQAEKLRQMKAHLPTNPDLRATNHNHIRYKFGPVECTGAIEVVDCFGTKTEDASGYDLTDDHSFNKSTAVTYEYAYVTMECQNPECLFPRFALDNPKREAIKKESPSSNWRAEHQPVDQKRRASGEK